MSRIESLSILLDPTGKDLLAEKYGDVIDNLQKTTRYEMLKNKNLSGDPSTGSVEAKRFSNISSEEYGTARAAGAGGKIKAKPVTIKLDKNRELVTEIEYKDTTLYGVDNIITRHTSNHGLSMGRELNRAFFSKAVISGTVLTPTKTNIEEMLEELILQIETTKNDYVDGIPRDLISVGMIPTEYAKIRDYLDKSTNNANVNTSAEGFERFHGVRVYSEHYIPKGTKMVGMVDEAIALPVMTSVIEPTKIPLSDAIGFGLFFYYGVEAVTPDLIFSIAG